MASICGPLTVNVNLKQRPAVYAPKISRPELGLTKGQVVNVGVFGLFQVHDGEDVDAYFVVELPDGSCTYTGVSEIKFTDVRASEEEAVQ